ncbi:hypothetical protein KY317_04280 [Candidatus Woesearchaeota archaeon]|nr:hypothetical protein [Candidatus Woesearchaeota archaeon]
MTHEKEFPRDMSFTNRRGQVVHPSKEDYNSRISEKIGKAYGFFDCNASKEEIEAELPKIRELAQTPSELELSLIEGVDNLKGDPELMKYIAQEVKLREYRFVLEATYSGMPNSKAAAELEPVFNLLTMIYEDRGIIKGDIVYDK